jgi:hypothetical protein
MAHNNAPREAAFGYLSTWDSQEHGCLGGYLIVSAFGRPLEFHCTAPLRTSRAQQILFGPTLWPYVLGEQIGGTLLGEAKLQPRIVIADHPATLCLRARNDVPFVCLKAASSGSPREVCVAGSVFELPSGFECDREAVSESLTLLAQHVELGEPFERIREAIREAQRIGEHNQDIHEEAA